MKDKLKEEIRGLANEALNIQALTITGMNCEEYNNLRAVLFKIRNLCK